jgi:hypothetical protein
LCAELAFDLVYLIANASKASPPHQARLSNNATAIMMDVAFGEQSLALESAPLFIADLIACVLGSNAFPARKTSQ